MILDIISKIMNRLADALERFGERCKKQPAKPQASIPKTHVTDKSLYTQDWEREETTEQRFARLEALKLKQVKDKLKLD